MVYVQTPPSKKFPNGDVRFVKANGKIVPIKGGPGNTTPKLELTAMVMAAHLVVFAKKSFGNFRSSQSIYMV